MGVLGFRLVFFGWNSRIQESLSWQVLCDSALPLCSRWGGFVEGPQGREGAREYLHPTPPSGLACQAGGARPVWRNSPRGSVERVLHFGSSDS